MRLPGGIGGIWEVPTTAPARRRVAYPNRVGAAACFNGVGQMSTGLGSMDIGELLDEARKATGARTDTELAKKLGVTANSVSNYRSGYSLPKAAVCERLAKITGKKPLSVIAIVEEQRAISTEDKAVWRRLASAAALLLSVGVLGGLAAHPDAQARPGSISHNYDRMHIMSFRLRRLARTLRVSIWRLACSQPAYRGPIWT